MGKARHPFVAADRPGWDNVCVRPEPDQDNRPCGWPREDHDVSEPSDIPFNPHGEKTSDGVVITRGMRVLDYNRRPGTVTADRDATEHSCRAVNPDVTAAWSNPDADPPCHNGWANPRHWFDVTGDDTGGGGMFDGSRLQSL